MRIISKTKLKEFWEKHSDSETALEFWYQNSKKALWKNSAELKKDFPHADSVGRCTVFNVDGNKYRLVTKIIYAAQVIYIRFVLTHPEYDKDFWKSDCRK